MSRAGLVVLLVGAVALSACDSGVERDPTIARSPRPRNTGGGQPPLKIGLVGTMTGTEAWRGEDAFEGADLAVHNLNKGLGRGERRYELEVLDDGGDAARSLELIGNLLSRGETVGIVYAGPPEAVVDAEDLLKRSEVPAVVCYGDLYSARQLSPHVFQAAPPYLWQARDIARYLRRDRAYRRVGVLTEAGTMDGATASTVTRDSLRSFGINNVVSVEYQADVRLALDRLRARQVEAIVMQGAPAALERIYDEITIMGARYRDTDSARVASASKKLRNRRVKSGWWHPQILGFDLMLNDRVDPPPPGSLSAASYSRGVHYLPIPSFERFRKAFMDWWDAPPRGFEQRAYEATLMIGRAADRAGDGDIARALEELRSERLGGLPVTLGPDDHVTVEEATIGLWTVPFAEDAVPERERIPSDVPWVPLARGFSIDGETTDIDASDWKWLFRNAPPRGGPAPKFTRMKFGVTTKRSDPIR